MPENTPQLDSELEKELKSYEKKSFKSLIDQVEYEYQAALAFSQPKFDEWAVRLKLYNNQKRDKTAVGDPLLFTIHQTVLASLYDDRLGVTFLGREQGDDEIAENLSSLAEYDWDEMDKEKVDYEWDWDTGFFGRGLLNFSDFDRTTYTPIPEVINPMTWLRDPLAQSVNGDRRGRGAMRFGGREIRKSKDDMKREKVYFNLGSVKNDNRDFRSLIDRANQARAEAQGFNNPTMGDINPEGENQTARLLEWRTIYKGQKIIVTLANNRKTVVRYTELPNRWQIIDRSLFPISHDWDGVSIPDLVEDKQRARAKLTNLGLKIVETGLHPTYLFDTNKIKNRAEMLNLQQNKHVGVDGNPTGAVIIAPKDQVKADVTWILNALDTSAQKATATPDIQQGTVGQEKRTATELSIVSNKVDTRYSLSAKIFGWSEKAFWKEWYLGYKDHFHADIDEKLIRIVGAIGYKYRKLTKENIIAENDPDIKIESKIIAEQKRQFELNNFRALLKDVLAVEPQANKRYALKHEAKLSGLRKDEIDRLLPPTYDELRAEDENQSLDKGKKVTVEVTDDDMTHLDIHNKAADTPQKLAHIEAHKKAMLLKKSRPDLFQPPQPMDAGADPAQSGGMAAIMTGGMSGGMAAGGQSFTPRVPKLKEYGAEKN